MRRCAREVWFIFGAFVSNYSKLAKHTVEVYNANISMIIGTGTSQENNTSTD